MSSTREPQNQLKLPLSLLVNGIFRTFPPQFNVTSQASNLGCSSLSNLSSASQLISTLPVRPISMQPWLGPTPSQAPTRPKAQKTKKEKKGCEDPLTTTAIDKHPKEQKTLQAAKVASSDNNTAKFTPGTRVEKSSPPPNENLMNPTVPSADDVDEPTAPASPDVLSKEPNVEEGLDLMVKHSRGGILDRLKRRLDDGHFKLLKSPSSKLPETTSIRQTQDNLSDRAHALNYTAKVSGVDPSNLPIVIPSRPSGLQLELPTNHARVAGKDPCEASDMMTITPWTFQDNKGNFTDEEDHGNDEHVFDSVGDLTELSKEPMKTPVLQPMKSKERIYDTSCIGRTAPPVPPPKNPKRIQTRLYNNHPCTFVSGLQESPKTWPKSPDDPNWDDAVALLKYRAAEEKKEADREAKMAKKSEQEKKQSKQERHMKNALDLLERGNMLGLGPEKDFRNMTKTDLLKLGEELEEGASRSQTQSLKNKFRAIDSQKAREDLALQGFLRNRIQNVARERERRAANQKDVGAAKAKTAKADYENSIRFTAELYNSNSEREVQTKEDCKRPESLSRHYTSSPDPDEQTRLKALRAIGLDPDQRSEYGDTETELIKTLRHLCGDGTPVLTARGHVGLEISDSRHEDAADFVLECPSIPKYIQIKSYSKENSMVDLDRANVRESMKFKFSEQTSIGLDAVHDHAESIVMSRPETRLDFHSRKISETDDDGSEYSNDPNSGRVLRQPISPLFDPPLQVASSGKLHPSQFKTAAFYPERSESFNRKLRKVSEKRMVELDKQKSYTSLRQASEEASCVADWVHPALRGATPNAIPLPPLPSMNSAWDTQSQQDAFNSKCANIIAFAKESSLDEWFDEDDDENFDDHVQNKRSTSLHRAGYCHQASIDIQNVSLEDEGYGTGSYTRPISQSPGESPRTSFHDDTMRELFAKIDDFRFPIRPSSKLEVSNDCNLAENLKSETLDSDNQDSLFCDANGHRKDEDSPKPVASLGELGFNVYPKPMIDFEHLVEQHPKMSQPIFSSALDYPHIIRSKSLQNLRTQNGLPPLKLRERNDEKQHPSHEYTWLTEKLMCYSVHTPVVRLPDIPNVPKDSKLNLGDLPSKHLRGHYEVPKLKLQRCACCQRSCCLYASKLQISMIDTNNVAEEHIRACAEAEVDKLRSIYPNGIDEFNTFLACLECSRIVCPRCADLCEERHCRQVMCKDHAVNGKCSSHEQVRS